MDNAKNKPVVSDEIYRKAKNLIKNFENFAQEKTREDDTAYPYYDSKGLLTIEYMFNLMMPDVCDDVARCVLNENIHLINMQKLSYDNALRRTREEKLEFSKTPSRNFNEKIDTDKVSNTIFASLKKKWQGDTDTTLQAKIQESFNGYCTLLFLFRQTKINLKTL